MKYPLRIKLECLFTLCFAGWMLIAQAVDVQPQPAQPKYIFLMIGDGMGVSQRASAEMYKRITTSAKPGEENGQLVMNRFPIKGLTTTHPNGSPITDSAAAATAIACGEKTQNGRIAVSYDNQKKFRSIAYDAQEAGMKVGIVSSVPIDHATPACFYAHQASRGNYYEIAIQVASSKFNYFAGQSFLGANKKKMKGRPAPENVAKKAGYTSFHGKDGLTQIHPGMDKILWLNNTPYAIDSQEGDVTLADLTRKGIKVLENKQGFFLMVEGGKIDWTGHANDLATNIKETLAFDQAVQIAYDFYREHPRETLIIVTGDHETGGLKTAFSGGFSPPEFVRAINGQKKSGARFAPETKTWVSRKISQQDALERVCETFGLKNLTSEEKAELNKVIEYTLNTQPTDTRPPELKQMYGTKNMVANACQTIIAHRCGITWTSFGHSGAAVTTTAIGPGSDPFAGQTDNTDIAKILRNILH